MAIARAEPVQEYYSIGEVCSLTELKPHVLRYWESQFKLLNPAKNRSGNRVYARREVELILLVKHLLYAEKYTIDGARQKLDEHRKGGSLRAVARAALEVQTIESVERELADLLAVLEDRPVSAPREMPSPPPAD
ncbi:MAG: MerR family transcriptional regulator [Gemmatimonadaceae bacterium]|nr:MerR family transcriptional regulator [Gemmatimonadaceae bacterium]